MNKAENFFFGFKQNFSLVTTKSKEVFLTILVWVLNFILFLKKLKIWKEI